MASRLRRTARVLLFDQACGDLLLIRFVAVRDDGNRYEFWVTPGGEIEAAESASSAATRELGEELGLCVAFNRPFHQCSGGEYVHLGEHVRNDDVFFVAECARTAPLLGGVTADEIRLMREARWWTVAELIATHENIFPADLATLAKSAWLSQPTGRALASPLLDVHS